MKNGLNDKAEYKAFWISNGKQCVEFKGLQPARTASGLTES